MASSPTTDHIAKSNSAVAGTSAQGMPGYTGAHLCGKSDTTSIMPASPTKSSVATSTTSLTERATLTTPTHIDTATLEAKPWPRLHLLGLPRELRDQSRVSRQLRSETHRMFLERNMLEVNERALMTIRSSKPFDAFKALCAGSELQKICMDSSRSVGPYGEVKVEMFADLIVVKANHGVKVSLPVLFGDYDGYEICGCRVERLANEYDG